MNYCVQVILSLISNLTLCHSTISDDYKLDDSLSERSNFSQKEKLIHIYIQQLKYNKLFLTRADAALMS